MTRTFVRDNTKPFVASQSAMRVLTDCERKFQHAYVLHTVRDVDYVEPTYFRFGSALHALAERTRHDFAALTPEMVEGACMEYRLDWEKDGAKLVAMLREYSERHMASVVSQGIEILALELELVTRDWVMYIDAVLRNSLGMWWMADLKSASEFDPVVENKMRHDAQVNLYMAHAHLVAEKLGLDMAKFVGFEYREIMKPKERLKKSETRAELIERMVPPIRFTLLSSQYEGTNLVVEQMGRQLERARAMFTSSDGITENRSLCHAKGTTCPYYSRCNGGKTYTQLKEETGNADSV
jgi:hypothetical protein